MLLGPLRAVTYVLLHDSVAATLWMSPFPCWPSHCCFPPPSSPGFRAGYPPPLRPQALHPRLPCLPPFRNPLPHLTVLLGPLRAVTYVLLHGSVAATLGTLWKSRFPWWPSILLSSAVRLFGQFAYLVLSSLTMNENFFWVVLSNVHSMLVSWGWERWECEVVELLARTNNSFRVVLSAMCTPCW